eukprot:Nk52_evm1s1636 gene=Nk52_evmTU1s1636
MYIDTVNEIHLHLMFSFLNIPNIFFHRVHDLRINRKRTKSKKKSSVNNQYEGVFSKLSKLSVWSLTQYRRVMYVDMDVVLVSENLLRVWDEECDDKEADLCLTVDIWKGNYHDKTNVIAHQAGMMVVRPSNELLSVMNEKIWNGWHVSHQLQEQAFIDFFFHEQTLGGKMQTFYNKSYNILPHDQNFSIPLEQVLLAHLHLDRFYSKSYTASHNIFEEDYVIKMTPESSKIKIKERAEQAMNAFRPQFMDLFRELSASLQTDKETGPSSKRNALADMRRLYVQDTLKKFYSYLVEFANDMPIFKEKMPLTMFEDINKQIKRDPRICVKALGLN